MRAQHRRFCDRRVIFSSIFGWVQAPGLEAGELVDRSYSGRPRSRPWHLARCRPGDVSAPDLERPDLNPERCRDCGGHPGLDTERASRGRLRGGVYLGHPEPVMAVEVSGVCKAVPPSPLPGVDAVADLRCN